MNQKWILTTPSVESILPLLVLERPKDVQGVAKKVQVCAILLINAWRCLSSLVPLDKITLGVMQTTLGKDSIYDWVNLLIKQDLKMASHLSDQCFRMLYKLATDTPPAHPIYFSVYETALLFLAQTENVNYAMMDKVVYKCGYQYHTVEKTNLGPLDQFYESIARHERLFLPYRSSLFVWLGHAFQIKELVGSDKYTLTSSVKSILEQAGMGRWADLLEHQGPQAFVLQEMPSECPSEVLHFICSR